MKMKVLFVLSMTLGYLEAAENSVTVEVPCHQRNSKGECTSWGGLVQGCQGPCSINVSVPFLGSASCSAQAGKSCNAILPSATSQGTTHANIPCITNDESGKCIRWGSMNQGCKAPADGTCQTNLTIGDKHVICNGAPGATCNSNIRMKLP